MPRLLVIGNPDNRRIGLLRAAARRTGWSLDVAAYAGLLGDLLAGDGERAEAAAARLAARAEAADAVRLESPGECFEVERRLLALGADDARREASREAAAAGAVIEPQQAARLEEQLGRVYAPRQYYLGYRRLLLLLGERLDDSSGVRWMTHPDEVLCMFDKPSAARRLAACGVATPAPIGLIERFDELTDQMRSRQWPRVFVKLANGSSASGVAAVYHDPRTTWALSTVELQREGGELRLYNSLKIRRYRGEEEVAELIDALTPHRLWAERWLPKAGVGRGEVCDLRVVVVAGQPTHYVVRVSRSPMTNLHLGNRRGDWPQLQQRLGAGGRERLDDLCRQAAAAFPRAHATGLDVLLSPNLQQMRVLEANAYGDLLPGITDDRGRDTYERELADW